ncbi:MAG TPA: serine protease [Burkholderiales bacterium]|nr:serine protease [Burkholderiales bacterium]
MSFRARLLHLAVALLCAPALAQEPEPELSLQTHALFERIRDSVAQIRVLLGTSDTHAATGSGFAVGDGLIVTNYHVIADKALEPDVYRLEFVLPDGRRGPLQIVALDVVNDLAVVKGDTGPARALALRSRPLSKGDRGFSLGYPLGQGLTVVEGIYNGLSEELYYERIHFTGAINSGMSGGPAVDSAGRVFGVNVATHRRGQLVSFLVPASYAQKLLERARSDEAPPPRNFSGAVGAQLRSHDRALQKSLEGPLPTQQLGPLVVPARMGAFMQCAAGTERERERPYDVNSYFCYMRSAVYVDPKLQTGTVVFRHRVLRSQELGPLRFAHVQETKFRDSVSSDYTSRRHHTEFVCQDRIVALDGVRAKVAQCLRRYKLFEGLYDMTLKVATLGDSSLALHSELQMDGVSYEHAMRLSQRFLEAIRWNQ